MKCINSLSDASTEEQQSELPQIAINIGELVLRPPNEYVYFNYSITNVLISFAT